MKFHKIELKCPECGMQLTAHSALDGSEDAPNDGDISICGECRAFLIYTGSSVRLMTEDEIVDLPGDIRAEMVRFRAFLRERDAKH